MTDIQLRNFLAEGLNSVSRERMYFHYTHFDLQMAAARRGYALAVFEPEVDREGFDVILDDADQARRFQLKTILSDAGTNSWDVRKRLLRPSMQRGDQLNLPYHVRGMGGGLILQVIEYTSQTTPITYRYSDFDLLHSVERGYIQASGQLGARATQFFTTLLEGVGSETISVPKHLTFSVRDAASLLAVAGFHNPVGPYLPFDNFYLAEVEGFNVDMQPPFTDQQTANAARIQHSSTEVVSLLLDDRLSPNLLLPNPGG